MFNPTRSQQLQTSIIQAINDLVVQSKTNTQSILDRQTQIQNFKQALKTLEDSSKIVDAEDSPETLEQVRAQAVQQDCKTLAGAIDQISSHISSKNTKQALDLIDPFIKNSQLLKTRVQYVHELEQLISDFEQEKQVRSRLQKVAAALDLSMDTPVPSTATSTLTNPLLNDVSTAAQLEEVSTSTQPEEVSTAAQSEPVFIQETELPTPAATTPSTTTANTTTTETPPSYVRPSFLISEAPKTVDNTFDKEEPAANADYAVPVKMESTSTYARDENQDKAERMNVDLSHNSVLELEKLLNPEPKSPSNTEPLDFNKINTTANAKHREFMLQDEPHSFELDADILSGKTLQDDLDSLLLEAELLEKQANLKRSTPATDSKPLSSLFSFNNV